MGRLRDLMVIGGLALLGCNSKEEPKAPKGKEPDEVTVQHILISFQGKLREKDVPRTQEEARVLAEELLQRARGGR